MIYIKFFWRNKTPAYRWRAEELKKKKYTQKEEGIIRPSMTNRTARLDFFSLCLISQYTANTEGFDKWFIAFNMASHRKYPSHYYYSFGSLHSLRSDWLYRILLLLFTAKKGSFLTSHEISWNSHPFWLFISILSLIDERRLIEESVVKKKQDLSQQYVNRVESISSGTCFLIRPRAIKKK